VESENNGSSDVIAVVDVPWHGVHRISGWFHLCVTIPGWRGGVVEKPWGGCVGYPVRVGRFRDCRDD
jgi:hypothetical protein